jgi:outer membrane lipoprotein-sorting protein
MKLKYNHFRIQSLQKKVCHMAVSLFVLITFASMASAQDADAILERVDRNMASDSRVMESSMTIRGKRSSRTVTSKSWGEGTARAFTEYLSPAAERGTKMLKLEGQLWIYSPSTDRTIQISGHMLKQSVMGSDLSYEDMMDDRKLSEVYAATLSGEEITDGRKTWVLKLTARVPDVPYHSQKLWIDAERYIPLKQEMYAKSGQLLKRTLMSDVRQVQGRWFPFVMVYKDMLKQGNGTEFRITSIRFNEKIPEYLFSKAALKQ